MRALFVGGVIDNNELDLEGGEPPMHYPPRTGGGQPRYRLHAVGRGGDGVACAVYAAPGLDPGEVRRISGERAYARRFGTELRPVD